MTVSTYADFDRNGQFIKLVMELACEGEHGMFGGSREKFEGQNYVELRAKTAKSGWRRVYGGMWLGPCCVGVKVKKEKANAEGD